MLAKMTTSIKERSVLRLFIVGVLVLVGCVSIAWYFLTNSLVADQAMVATIKVAPVPTATAIGKPESERPESVAELASARIAPLARPAKAAKKGPRRTLDSSNVASNDVAGPKKALARSNVPLKSGGLSFSSGSIDAIQQTAFWNYWVSDAGQPTFPSYQAPRLEPIKLEVPYRARFLLSSFDLSSHVAGIGAISTAPALQDFVSRAVSEGSVETLLLDVLVNPLDPRFLSVSDETRKSVVTIDLQKLRALASSSSTLKGQSVEDIVATASLGQFAFDFTIHQDGMHQIGVVIFDHRSGIPVQTLTAEFAAEKSWQNSLVVHSSDGAVSVAQGDRINLVLVLQEQTSSTSIETLTRLVATLGHLDDDDVVNKFKHANWVTEMANFRSLHDLVTGFVASEGAISNNKQLLQIAEDLGSSLFSPLPLLDNSAARSSSSAENLASAQRARGIIEKAAQWRKGTTPPTLLVWLRQSAATPTGKYETDVLPISAISVQSESVGGSATVLGDRFVLALVLPGQTNLVSTPCPSNWYAALPGTDVALDDTLKTAVASTRPVFEKLLRSADIKAQSADMGELLSWLRDDKGTDPYVFSFLGHSGDTGLSYATTANAVGINASNVRRSFGGSSIAILNACATAMLHITDGMPLGRFAKRGVAATIATTSKISGELAAAYLDCFTSVLANNGTLSIGEAHLYTTQCLRGSDVGDGSTAKYLYSGGALKYMLVGNPFQQICNPKKDGG